jgi:hypothetical protein
MKFTKLCIAVATAWMVLPCKAQTVYDVTNSLDVTNADVVLTHLNVMLPVPQTNIYQTIENYTSSVGSIEQCTNNDNRYLNVDLLTDLPQAGETMRVWERYRALLYPVYVDMSQFETIYPYDTSSDIYLLNTGNTGDLIVPTNPTIMALANELWEQHPDIIGYARACYEYVGTHFSYLNANTGIHPLAENLANGGGDCGNLSAIYISLLRAQNIPSRPVVMVRPDGTFHVWADFYLQKYGWIPVDVTAKVQYPNMDMDFFGWYPGDGVIMSFGFNSGLYYFSTHPFVASLLQTYLWFYSYKSGNLITPSYSVQSSVVEQPATQLYYQTPGDGHLILQWTTVLGATGYRVRVYNRTDENTVVLDQVYPADATNADVTDLVGDKTYGLELRALRQVDGMETYMARCAGDIYLSASLGTGLSDDTVVNAPHVSVHGRTLDLSVARSATWTVTSASGVVVLRKQVTPGFYSCQLPAGVAVVTLTYHDGTSWVRKVQTLEAH